MCLLLKAIWERRFISQVQKFDTVTSENSESGVCTEAADILGQTVTLVKKLIENWYILMKEQMPTERILLIFFFFNLNDVRHVLIMC